MVTAQSQYVHESLLIRCAIAAHIGRQVWALQYMLYASGEVWCGWGPSR
jgi:hypothetical protein